MIAKMREFKICAAEKLLLVRILSERVIFQASSEGREGRAVTGRKRIPDLCSRKTKGVTIMLF